MYGSSRLGVIKENKLLKLKPRKIHGYVIANPCQYYAKQNTTKTSIYPLGKKHYETTDWLGNVRVTYTDKKSWQQNKFALNVSSSQDYYPFGSVMEGRNLEITNYRFGFQGQEGDDEIFGKNNLWAYKYRLHDARLGRFFSVDPLADKYPYNSVYAFSENRVIDGVELEGLEVFKISDAYDAYGNKHKIVQLLDINRDFEVIDENNRRLSHFKYIEIQKELGGVQKTDDGLIFPHSNQEFKNYANIGGKDNNTFSFVKHYYKFTPIEGNLPLKNVASFSFGREGIENIEEFFEKENFYQKAKKFADEGFFLPQNIHVIKIRIQEEFKEKFTNLLEDMGFDLEKIQVQYEELKNESNILEIEFLEYDFSSIYNNENENENK
ncbi:MAG: hypothetical protein KatS3mg027_2708 [Bacteroidia bacterium]|nr:MAG: hypothetical protein KatS3mg027_2708 [Bacteroidia bacterium]